MLSRANRSGSLKPFKVFRQRYPSRMVRFCHHDHEANGSKHKWVKWMLGGMATAVPMCSLYWIWKRKDQIKAVYPRFDVALEDEELVKKIVSAAHEMSEYAIQCKKEGVIDNDNHLVIFLHGYNNDNAAVDDRVVSIDNNLGTKKVISVAFNWKSFATFYKYHNDQECAEKSAIFLVKYIDEIKKCGQFKKIDIVAHSMGNYILIKSIKCCSDQNRLHLFEGCNIISVAADVDHNEYTENINKIKHIISSWTHYYNPLDAALLASFPANAGSVRAGTKECAIADVNSIKCQLLGSHGYIDRIQLLQEIKNKLIAH